MAGLPDIESLSQQIAKLHIMGDLILDPEPVGKHIRRVTTAQIMNAPAAGPEDLLVLGGRECKYVEVVVNVACVTKTASRIQFTLDDGFGRMDAWLSLERGENPALQATISSLTPFDYAHIEGKVRRPVGEIHTTFEIISIRRLQTGYETFLHLLQVLSEIDETIKEDSPVAIVPPAKLPKPKRASNARAPSIKRYTSTKGKEKVKEPPRPEEHADDPQETSISARPRRIRSVTFKEVPPPPSTAPSSNRKSLGKHILKYFRRNIRAATSSTGIAVDDKVLEYLMVEQDMMDLTTKEFQEAIEYLIEEGYIDATIDEFHYRLLTTT